ncbi:MAG: hypothetical protein IH991_12225, partial [Planctomycetes bacterium]|nr:hypothetical protein [Planctomycetota bacterium]
MRSHSFPRMCLGVSLFLAVAFTGVARSSHRTLPGPVYYAAFRPYYAGEYRDAVRAFRDSARNGLIGVQGRWVDSICYHTMMGECFYQMGDIAKAVEQYEAALKLYLAYNGWMLRVEFPPALTPANPAARARITWGASKRVSRLGHFPSKMMVLMGRLDNDRVARQGGVIEVPELRPVVVQEVARCTALAIRRRHEILGPACKHDPLTDELVDALSRRPAPPNHWSQAFINVQLGLAFASADRKADARATLQQGSL